MLDVQIHNLVSLDVLLYGKQKKLDITERVLKTERIYSRSFNLSTYIPEMVLEATLIGNSRVDFILPKNVL